MPDRPDPTLVPLPDGRMIAVDDVGDPVGRPVLYLHGTPDSRLSRHPDDGLAAAAGVRLLAVDRPGCGRSGPHPGRTLGSVADDVVAALDALEVVGQVGIVAWSGGAPYAVALAARHPERVTAVALAAPVVPLTALAEDPELLTVAEGRTMLLEMADGIDPLEVGREVAPYMVPDPATLDAVLAQQAEEGGAARRRDVAGTAGGAEALATATVECVGASLAGLVDDVATSLRRADVDLGGCIAPVLCLAGADDDIAPPAFARWWASTLPHATAEEVAGAGHALHLAHWTRLLAHAATPPTP